MSGSSLTTADYDPVSLAGIASATGGPGASTSLGQISVPSPREPQPSTSPEVRERVRPQPRQEAPLTSGASDAVPKQPHQIVLADRRDPATWGPKRTPDDLTRFWSQEGGLTPIAAQGVAMAAQQESGLHPWAPGDFVNGQMTSFGTYQHHKDRLEALKAYAAQNGLDPNDGHTQDLFALHETKSDPQLRAMMSKLNAAQTPQEAQAIWRKEFERPAGITPNMPYAPTAWDEGKVAMGNQFLSQMMQEFKEGKDKIGEIDKDYKPVKISEQPKPPDPDPLKAFGSLAGIFSQLAAGFSRTPAIAAMNGMAGAINAAKEHDWEQYSALSKAWKENADATFRAHEQHSKDVNDAFSHLSTNVNLAHAMLEATSALAKDDQMAKHLANQDYAAMVKLQLDRDEAGTKAKEAAPLAHASEFLYASQMQLDAAMKTGNKEQIDEARAHYDEALKHYQEIKQAPYAGRPGSQEGAMREAFFKEHPGATVEDWGAFYQRYIKGKEDPTVTGARKDEDLERKKRVDQVNADHRDRMATIAEDRNTSTVERDRRLAEERERHDKATEALGEHKAFTGDRTQNERERHNLRIEEITSNRDLSHNDVAVAILDERARHDRAIEGKDHTTAAERQTKMFEDDIRKEPKFETATDSEVRTEANRRITASKRPEAQHLNPDALDMEAKQLLLTGNMPSMGFGGTDTRVQIINRAAQLAAEQGHTIEDYISGRATWKADVASLGQITKISDAVQGFENTALENMKVAESLMDKGAGTKFGPVVNRWLQAGKSGTGDPDVASFNLAMGTVASEYGKIISGGSASIAATPEGARKEAEEWMNKIQSPQAIKAQFAAARKDMENRKNSLFRQRSLIQERLKDPLAPAQAGPEHSTGGLPEAMPGEVVHKDANGVRAVQRDGKWIEVR